MGLLAIVTSLPTTDCAKMCQMELFCNLWPLPPHTTTISSLTSTIFCNISWASRSLFDLWLRSMMKSASSGCLLHIRTTTYKPTPLPSNKIKSYFNFSFFREKFCKTTTSNEYKSAPLWPLKYALPSVV